jgi:hypothetical protein
VGFYMSKDRFDLEHSIMECWNVTEDISMVTEHFMDSPKWEHIPPDVADALCNKYLGIKELYDIRFQKLWDTFTECFDLDRDSRGEDPR